MLRAWVHHVSILLEYEPNTMLHAARDLGILALVGIGFLIWWLRRNA